MPILLATDAPAVPPSAYVQVVEQRAPAKGTSLSSSLESIGDLPVGELGNKWRFPSDHLPVGGTIDGFHIATWNVLNTRYISWIEGNGQGLAASLIMGEHRISLEEGFTVRDLHVLKNVFGMLEHPTHPRSILALQECSPAFIKKLKEKLPAKFRLITSSSSPTKEDMEVVLYDATQFDYVSEQSVITTAAYPSAPGKAVMNLLFVKQDTAVKYRVMNTHVPGDPNLPGRYELARYAFENKKEGEVTIVLGDMNFNLPQMQEAFGKAAQDKNQTNRFAALTSYRTCLGIKKDAKAIDYIFVDSGSVETKIATNSPDSVLKGLEETVKLLK